MNQETPMGKGSRELTSRIVLTITLLTFSVPAFSQQTKSNMPSFVPYQRFQNAKSAEDFMANGDQSSVLIKEGRGIYYAAKGPFFNAQDAALALHELTIQDRSRGICRFYKVGSAVPHGRFYSSRVRNIRLYFSFYDIKTYEPRPCPPSQEVPKGVTLASQADLQRIYIDERSIKNDGSWRKVDILTEFDFRRATFNKTREQEISLWSKRETYIFSCPLDGGKYILKNGYKYFSQPWQSGESFKGSNLLSAELPDYATKKILSETCQKPTRYEKFADLAIFNATIQVARTADEKEAAAKAVIDARNARESARDLAERKRKQLMKELGPREYFVSVTCELGNGYGRAFKVLSEAEAWRLGRQYALQIGIKGGQNCWVHEVRRWN